MDTWSLPGGFVQMEESLGQAANRVIAEKAGLRDIFVEQLYTFGSVNRDPRGRVVTVAYFALVDSEQLKAALPNEDSNRKLAPVHFGKENHTVQKALTQDSEGHPIPLAFDHEEILGVAIARLQGKLNYSQIGFELLPNNFTLRQLQKIHETILGHSVNKDAFRKRMLATGLVESTGQREEQVGHRPSGTLPIHVRTIVLIILRRNKWLTSNNILSCDIFDQSQINESCGSERAV